MGPPRNQTDPLLKRSTNIKRHKRKHYKINNCREQTIKYVNQSQGVRALELLVFKNETHKKHTSTTVIG